MDCQVSEVSQPAMSASILRKWREHIGKSAAEEEDEGVQAKNGCQAARLPANVVVAAGRAGPAELTTGGVPANNGGCTTCRLHLSHFPCLKYLQLYSVQYILLYTFPQGIQVQRTTHRMVSPHSFPDQLLSPEEKKGSFYIYRPLSRNKSRPTTGSTGCVALQPNLHL